jgi:ADP-ribosylglycohydrolase
LPIHISRIFNSNKRYPNVPQLEKNENVLNAIYGAFFGFLVGDIAGAHLAYTTQRMDLYLPSALLMNGGGTYNLGAGQGSDQTEILFSACYGLIEGKGIYNQNLMAKIYLEWIESKPFNFSTLIALALRELRTLKCNQTLDEKKMGRILR